MRRSDLAALQAVADAHRGVFTHAEAQACGITTAALRWAVESGSLHRVMAGAFTTRARWESASPRGRHVLVLRAAQRRSPGSIACGLSAAALWNLPLPQLGEPTMMSVRRSGRESEILWRKLVVTRAGRVGGLMVTTPARTVVDCARELDRPWGLAVADAALHEKLTSVDELATELQVCTGTTGIAKARWVVEHARPEPESPLESLARADLSLAGMPESEPQVWLRTRGGRVRVDLLDHANRVVLEADGKVKYTEAPTVWTEKLRQDDIRDLEIEVVRFTMYDHHHQKAWLPTYLRALTRGRLAAQRIGPVPVNRLP